MSTGNFWAGGGESEGKLGPWSTLKLDDLVFPGVQSARDPGACPVEITGGVGFSIDRVKIRGKDGHRLTADGYEPTKCIAQVKIYTEKQWAAFCAFLPTINPKIPRQRQTVDSKGRPVFHQPTKVIKASTTTATVGADRGANSVVHAITIPKVDQIVKVGSPVPTMESYRPSFKAEHPWLTQYGITQIYVNNISFPHEADGRMIRVVTLQLWEVFDIKVSGKGSTGGIVKGDALPDPNVAKPIIIGGVPGQAEGFPLHP